MLQWIASGLNRKFILAITAGAVVVSILFLAIFTHLYRGQLEAERSRASLHINRLLQASLENAMVKRDLDGLRAIVQRLGEQADIRGVTILNPRGEIRFSSRDELLGRHIEEIPRLLAEGEVAGPAAFGRFTTDDQGFEVLRSVNAVRNKPICTQCHGPLKDHPVNGVLLVDYDAEAIREQAGYGVALLAGSGAVVILLMALVAWWALRRYVVCPLHDLAEASRRLTGGNLAARVHLEGRDELQQLGETFNTMAASLQRSLEEVREKESFLQALIDAIPDGIRVIDGDFRVVKTNQAFCGQIGRSREEVLTTPCYSSSHGRRDPCPSALVACPVRELAGGGEPVKLLHQHRPAGGGELHVENYASPLTVTLAGQEHTFIVESVRDLDELVRFSHEQRLSALGLLASGVAHEIHNPLGSIRLAIQSTLKLMGRDAGSMEEIGDYLRTVDSEIDRCIEITRRLLRLSMPPGREGQLLDLAAPVNETLSLLRFEAESRGIRVVTELADPELRAVIDDGDLRMLILNLVQNAYHAMPRGGELRVTGQVGEETVMLTITDSGVGIPAERLSNIFEPFFSQRADGIRGTGLGLPICRSIVERAGGRIAIKSRVGEGSEVTVTLPRQVVEGAAAVMGMVAI